MSKRQLAILWGLAIVVVVILGTVGILGSRSRPSQPTIYSTARPATAQTNVYRLPETPYTARNLYHQAQETAQRWQPDATLVSASTSWSFVKLDDFSRPTDWTFQFYSSATQRAYLVNATETTASPIHETLSSYSLPAIAVNEWQLDSHQALNIWLNRGGGAFIDRQPIVDVSIRLNRTKERGVVWTIVGLDESGRAIQTEHVDASNP